VDGNGVSRRADVMDTGRPMAQGKAMRWATVERMGLTRHKRIDRAAQCGVPKQVRWLQTLLGRARAAKLLAVRPVTQDNRGQDTAGVDGKTALTPAGRLALVEELKRDGPAQPGRRVLIPKPAGTVPRRGRTPAGLRGMRRTASVRKS
jgi:RNA-directed DNA polymerase